MFLANCSKKKDTSTNPEEVSIDNIDVLMIDSWDRYQLVESRSEYPSLIAENYFRISKHEIVENGNKIGGEDYQGIFLNNNQIWFLDNNDVNNYVYDYFYNETTKALWLKADNSDTLSFDYDPSLLPDTVEVNLEDYILLYRHNQGPKLKLKQPANNLIIPDEDNDDLDDLTPKFMWEEYLDAQEYIIQVRTDTNFVDGSEDTFVVNDTVAVLEYQLEENLDNYERYYWRVKADNSNWSDIWTFTTFDIVSLNSPLDGKSASLKPTFRWNEFPEATNYTIQVSQDKYFGEENLVINDVVEGNEYVPGDYLQANSQYFWRVKSDNSENYWSKTRGFITDSKVKPESPVNFETEVPTTVTFSWEELDNASSYHLQVALDTIFTNNIVDVNLNVNEYEALLDANVEYYWRVDSDVAADWSEPFSFVTNTAVFLSSPSDDAENIPVLVQFKWREYNGAESYEFMIASDENFTDIHCDSVGITDTVYICPVDLESNREYFWKVKGNDSEWSEVWNFTTMEISEQVNPEEPENEDDNVSQLPKFVWGSIYGTQYYRIQVSAEEDFSNLIVNETVSSRTYTLPDEKILPYAHSYYWRVRSDRSLWSETMSFTVRPGIPTDFEAEANSIFKIDLSWRDNSEYEEKFYIERALSENGEWTVIDSVDKNVTVYIDFDKEPGITYYYRVRARSDAGFSGYSQIAEVTALDFNFTSSPEMIDVPAGTFVMGDTLNSLAEEDEGPLHTVELTHDFQIGKYEITNRQFADVLNWALGKGKIKGIYEDDLNYASDAVKLSKIIKTDSLECGLFFNVREQSFDIKEGMENYPVTDVLWTGAAAYANWLSEIEGLNSLYSGSGWNCAVYDGGEGYRLPTEAEWEYVAKFNGDSNDRIYPWGDEEPSENLANYYNPAGENSLLDVGSLPDGNNFLGISDIAGNAWEWCNDKYKDDYYAESPETDPEGPGGNVNSSARMVIRGGSWEYGAAELRNSNRSSCKSGLDIGRVNTGIGLRIVKINP
ncbi:MAG: hypothetical protein DRZ79_05055 [Candidatus Cloacimonadota bacterium]|nr:MAG: hypothetical protein DRZ79_05055 [Candidatus Cloacimonadota bacterium]